MAATTTTAATGSHFFGTRIADPVPGSGKIQARFGFSGFGKKKSPPPPPPRKAGTAKFEKPLVWFPGAKSPEWLDGSMVGDRGFDPFGFARPAEYLQYDFDSLDQNLAKNLSGDIIGVRQETTEINPTPFQPYTEVFGLQRFRECELIHGRWAMLGTLGAIAVEALTGVAWQDAGKSPELPLWSASAISAVGVLSGPALWLCCASAVLPLVLPPPQVVLLPFPPFCSCCFCHFRHFAGCSCCFFWSAKCFGHLVAI